MFDFVSAGFCRGNSVGSEQQRRAAMTCEGCSVKFNVFKRRRQCSICQRFYCSQCLPLGQNGNGNSTTSVLARFMEKKLKCSKCKVLTARPLSRSQLKQLRVKDLQLYLTSQKVSTRGCVEKDDLVNLLMWHAGRDERVPSDGNIAGCTVPPPPSQFATDDVASNFASVNPCTPSTSQPSTANNVQDSTPASEANATFDPGDETLLRKQASPTASSSSSSSSSKEAPEVTVSSSSSPSSVPSWVRRNSGINIVEVTDWEEGLVDPGPEPVVVVTEEDLSPSESSAPEQSNSSVDNECEMAVEVTELMPTVPEEDEVHEVESMETTEEIDQPSHVQPCTGITLASINRLEDLEQLTVKQLKELLCLNRVDFRGCCEKAELVERASRLWTANAEARKELENLNMDELCKVCMDAPIECVMLECGHMATCTACGKQLSECPICRQFVVRVVRTFRA